MVFSSMNFLFLFLPALLVAYFIVPKKCRGMRNMVLLIFSLLFYAYGEPEFVVVMVISILLNYVFGLGVEKGGRKGFLVFLAVLCNIGLLVYFKYTMFLIENINGAFGLSLTVKKIVMPIGISFFTFQGMSYVLDIYMGNAKAQKNPLNVMLYISLFPQLIAGPIVRYETVAGEITKRNENFEEFADGIVRFIIGLGKKIVIANQMGYVADKIFLQPLGEMTAPLAWIGAVAYTFQIYYDFSGYSDMAIGLGKIFGFHFLENFNYPYISRSVTEFWRRWHISLSTWFRDYIYIPMGGNRVSLAKQIRNIFVVWLLTGIWHGAAWNFMFWGIYFGVLLILEKYVYGRYLQRLWSPIQHIYAMTLVVLSWVLFRAPTLGFALDYIKIMFTDFVLDGKSIFYLHDYWVFFAIAFIGAMPFKVWLENTVKKLKSERVSLFLLYPAKSVFALCVFAVSFLYLLSSSFNPFIYFRF